MELGASQGLAFLGSELALAATALLVWLLRKGSRAHSAGAEVGIVGSALSLLLAARLYGWGEVWLCDRLLVVDGIALHAKILVALAVLAALWIDADAEPRTNEAPKILFAGLGLELTASAANLWTAVATLGLVTLALIEGAEVSRATRRVLLGLSLTAIASLAWLSGLGGAADFEALRIGLVEVLPAHGVGVSVMSAAFLFASVALFALFAVRSESQLSRGLLVGVGFNAALSALGMRFFLGSLSHPGEGGHWIPLDGVDWRFALALGAAGAMGYGAVAAVRARTLGRLVAAASVANVGYAFAAVSVATLESLRAVLFFLGANAVATLGAFFAVSLVAREAGSDDIGACRGLLRGRFSPLGVALAIFLLSLGGMPLLAGFPPRVQVLAAIHAEGERLLAAVAIASVALSLFAYSRLIRRMLVPRRTASPPIATADVCVLSVLAVVTMILGTFTDPLTRLAIRSANLLPF